MIAATYFDGRTARAHQVTLAFEAGDVVLSGGDMDRRAPVGSIVFDEELGSTPRIVRFVDGAFCEVPDHAGFAALAESHGIQVRAVARWERSWGVVTAAALFLIVGFAIFYRFALPAMAESAADRLPPTALNALSRQTLSILDRTMFTPTELAGRRRAALMNGLDALTLPGAERPRLSLDFRKSEKLGANAVALPSGTIIATDALVELMPDDRDVLAVLAHEAGHVARRHGLRKVIQSSMVAILITWYVGDVSALVATAPSVLIQAQYSRDLERDADAYAADTLELNGLSVGHLANALERLAQAHKGDGASTGPLSYLSSHPATAERLAWLRERTK